MIHIVSGILTDFVHFSSFQSRLGIGISMASGNPFFDDLHSEPEVIDPPQNEDIMDSESVNDPTQAAIKPNVTVSSSVRELLECPVCLNAMYPPIHQVGSFYTLQLMITF